MQAQLYTYQALSMFARTTFYADYVFSLVSRAQHFSSKTIRFCTIGQRRMKTRLDSRRVISNCTARSGRKSQKKTKKKTKTQMFAYQ